MPPKRWRKMRKSFPTRTTTGRKAWTNGKSTTPKISSSILYSKRSPKPFNYAKDPASAKKVANAKKVDKTWPPHPKEFERRKNSPLNDPGVFRAVTDERENLRGVITHPKEDKKEFLPAPLRPMDARGRKDKRQAQDSSWRRAVSHPPRWWWGEIGPGVFRFNIKYVKYFASTQLRSDLDFFGQCRLHR